MILRDREPELPNSPHHERRRTLYLVGGGEAPEAETDGGCRRVLQAHRLQHVRGLRVGGCASRAGRRRHVWQGAEQLPDVEAGEGDVQGAWQAFRGMAVEPYVRYPGTKVLQKRIPKVRDPRRLLGQS